MNPETQMNEVEFTIRAATLYRIVGNAQTVVLNEGKDGTFLNQLLSENQTPAIEALACMVMEMNLGGALAKFPVSDVYVLGEIVRYMISFYGTRPELAAKIAALCGIAMIGDGYGCPLITAPRNARLREIAELNNNLHHISKMVKYSPDFIVRVEFITMETVFHPESQFIRVVVTV